MMNDSRRWHHMIALMLPMGLAVQLAVADESTSPVGLLTLQVNVTMPDGLPARGAVVESIPGVVDVPTVVRTDEAGMARLEGVFGIAVRIHASSPDGAYQRTHWVSPGDARSDLVAPIKMQLAPAVVRPVRVEAEGQGVAGADVVAVGSNFRVRGTTGPDGTVELRLPAGNKLQALVAWHPQLGVAGLEEFEQGLTQESFSLSLLAPAPHTIRVIDNWEEPVGGLQLSLSVSTESSGWISAGDITATHFQTDEGGEAVVTWAPRDGLKYVGVEIIGAGWKVDKTDFDPAGDRLTTVHVRPTVPVQGRLIMPGGASAEGLLVKGFGFGTGSTGQIPVARARRDGSFVFDAAPGHAYVLGVLDREWAGEIWTGMILLFDTSEPEDIRINVSPAIPVTIHVTRGPEREPVVGAWVELNRNADLDWIDETGEIRSGVGGPRGWLITDTAGVARGGVSRGDVAVRVSSGDWDEEQSLNVASDEPIEIKFHRAR